MHANLMDMANTIEIPTLGITSDVDLQKDPEFIQKSRDGYGTLEKIGVVNCVTYVVPFIRTHSFFQNEKNFWNLPEDETHRLNMMTTVQPPQGNVHYITEKSKRKDPQSSQESSSQTTSQKRINRGLEYSDSDKDEEPTSNVVIDEEEEKKEIELPLHWPVQKHHCKVGTMVVLEVVYGKHNVPGISVSQVLYYFVYLFSFLLC